ncbi:tetratricopeptide repeat protein [Streptomyces sp. NPDC051172]|uniref:tetratricopeptide repeat protein n=1 Tax=Streptomyces sp. NPDC051172 TaxID=3155796 RepID=UPI00344435D8
MGGAALAGALAWLDGERGGLVAAVQWAREDRYADAAVRLSQCQAVYLGWRRYFDDTITVCGAAREADHHAGDQVGEAIAWNNLGNALRETGRAEEAVNAHTRARDLYQAAGDRHREASAWNNLGVALWKAGRGEEAVEAYGKALEVFREFEDWYGTGQTLHNLALVHQDAARPAHACYLQAADAYTRANAPTEAAQARTRADDITP